MPRDSCWPSPRTSKRPSGRISATTATTLLVPISSATIKSLMSRVIVLLVLCGGNGRQRDGEAIRITQVGVCNAAAVEGAREFRPCLHEALDARCKRQGARTSVRIGD